MGPEGGTPETAAGIPKVVAAPNEEGCPNADCPKLKVELPRAGVALPPKENLVLSAVLIGATAVEAPNMKGVLTGALAVDPNADEPPKVVEVPNERALFPKPVKGAGEKELLGEAPKLVDWPKEGTTETELGMLKAPVVTGAGRVREVAGAISLLDP
jgi:hypothetical protein